MPIRGLPSFEVFFRIEEIRSFAGKQEASVESNDFQRVRGLRWTDHYFAIFCAFRTVDIWLLHGPFLNGKSQLQSLR